MPTGHPTGEQPVTVSVPAVCAGRVRAEARDLLGIAAANAVEAVEWHRDRKDPDRLDRSDLPRLQRAEAIWRQVRDQTADGPVKVTGDLAAVAELLRCCTLGVADDIRDELEDRWAPRSVLALAAELTAWADLFRDSRLPTAPDAGRAV